MNKLYSTIGINGHNEAAEFLGLTCNYNEDYKKFISFITGIISEQNQLHSTPLFKFNTELVPKLSGHFKPLLIDSEVLMDYEGQASKICAA